MSLLDDLIYGLRDVYDATGNLLTRRSKIQFGAGLKAVDNHATGRIEVSATGGSVETLDELRAIPSAGLDNELRFVEETGTLWRYDARGGAEELDDGILSVKPNDKAQSTRGRWRPVVHNGLPGLTPLPGVTVPVSYLPASTLVLGARPIIDGSPARAPFFAGIAVDMGDTGGTKNPSPIMGLDENGDWIFATADWSTLRSTVLCRFTPTGLEFEPAPSLAIKVHRGRNDATRADVSLTIAAGDRGYGAAAGDLVLMGGEDNSPGGTGGDVKVVPGRSDAGAARRGSSILCDENETPIVEATSNTSGDPMLAFFNALPVTRPVITGSKSDGSAWESLLNALVALGLVEDQTTA